MLVKIRMNQNSTFFYFARSRKLWVNKYVEVSPHLAENHLADRNFIDWHLVSKNLADTVNDRRSNLPVFRRQVYFGNLSTKCLLSAKLVSTKSGGTFEDAAKCWLMLRPFMVARERSFTAHPNNCTLALCLYHIPGLKESQKKSQKLWM